MIGHALLSRARFTINRLRERLWVKPLMSCMFSLGMVFLAGHADGYEFSGIPDINADSIEALLSITTASMLVIAVFTTGSMLSAYASASEVATPRSFAVVIADDTSQRALSTFIAAFIFSIVSLTALLNEYYEQNGRFALFIMIMMMFAIVILSFLRWVDNIARLGRLGTVVDRVEKRTAQIFREREELPIWKSPVYQGQAPGKPIYSKQVGYLQRVDLGILEEWARESGHSIYLGALPGDFVFPTTAVAYLESDAAGCEKASQLLDQAMIIANCRTFDEDPAFGLVVLTEIASRALSPGVNDPGTAVSIIHSHVKLLTLWHRARQQKADRTTGIQYQHVFVPDVADSHLFDEAFDAISRFGAGDLDVMKALIESLSSLSLLSPLSYRDIAQQKIAQALRCAELALPAPEDVEELRTLAER